jgi:hypothetical protein
MAEARPFAKVKLICGLISGKNDVFLSAEKALSREFGRVESVSEFYPFDLTGYYDKEMGQPLRRRFLSFEPLVPPDELSRIKLETNRLEAELQEQHHAETRVVNIDPGCLSGSSLVMGTAKDFAHRIPLGEGIYAHLELLFGKDHVKTLEWTYPDFKSPRYHGWLLQVRKRYLEQIRPLGT